MVIEKKHRLNRDRYIGHIRVSFTLCIKGRSKIFIESNIVDIFNNILKYELEKQRVSNWIYLYMPDHLHLILEGKEESSDLWRSVVSFKQKTGYWLSKNKTAIRWQKDFYDYIHRKDDDLKKHIRYVLENPIRKKIVVNWDEYKFKGSLDYKLSDII